MDRKKKAQVTRRKFLKNSAAAGAASLSLPSIVGAGVVGNDDVVKVCVVGCGGRGSRDLRAISAVPNVKIVGVCELKDDRLKLAQEIAAPHTVPSSMRFTPRSSARSTLCRGTGIFSTLKDRRTLTGMGGASSSKPVTTWMR